MSDTMWRLIAGALCSLSVVALFAWAASVARHMIATDCDPDRETGD